MSGVSALSASNEHLLSDLDTWLFILAHPGHELRAYHAMERVQPTVAVLTDGSGSTSTPRLAESRALIAHTGAEAAPTFGPLTDREAYAALLAGDAGPFLDPLDRLVDFVVTQDIDAVVIDAAEGYNPVHDVCHWMGCAAVLRARHRGAQVRLFELDLIAHPDSPGTGIRLQLNDAAFTRKLDAISRYDALRAEADAAFERYGRDAFRIELLRDVVIGRPRPATWVPYYEEVGNVRVSEGRYTSVLRYGAHVRPVIDALLESAQPAPYASALGTLHQ
ncbi:MAG: hypothetical protein ABIX28_00220 [Vicinamibacterales bacterium]